MSSKVIRKKIKAEEEALERCIRTHGPTSSMVNYRKQRIEELKRSL